MKTWTEIGAALIAPQKKENKNQGCPNYPLCKEI
jgi:hypothetical protein